MPKSKSETTKQTEVLELIKRYEGIGSSQVADHLDLPLEVVADLLMKLEKRKLVKPKLVRKNSFLYNPLQREVTWYATK